MATSKCVKGLKKYPKKPKDCASLATWESYNKRLALVTKENAQKVAKHNKKVKLVESTKQKISKMRASGAKFQTSKKA